MFTFSDDESSDSDSESDKEKNKPQLATKSGNPATTSKSGNPATTTSVKLATTSTSGISGQHLSYDPKFDVKLTAQKAKVAIEKIPENQQLTPDTEVVESDSEYETEKVYEFREWYPPDFWRSKVQDNKNRIFMTDVTADDVTVTMIESCNGDGFFKEL